MNKEEIINTLSSLKDEVKREYKAELKGIFGSYARMENSEISDIDILVELDEEADLFDIAGLSIYLNDKLNRKIDIVPNCSIREELRDSILEETIYI